MATCNSETGNMLSKLKTFKTLYVAFPARVPELVRELDGEYGPWGGIVHQLKTADQSVWAESRASKTILYWPDFAHTN